MPLYTYTNYTEPLQSLAKSLSRTLTYHACDISSQSLTTNVFELAAAQARYPVRGLVNCAGIGIVGDSIVFPEDQTRRTLDVNLAGSLYVAQAAAKVVMKQYHEGKSLGASFLFVASMSGYISNKVSEFHCFSLLLIWRTCSRTRQKQHHINPSWFPRPLQQQSTLPPKLASTNWSAP